jgi:hypothetical protein
MALRVVTLSGLTEGYKNVRTTVLTRCSRQQWKDYPCDPDNAYTFSCADLSLYHEPFVYNFIRNRFGVSLKVQTIRELHDLHTLHEYGLQICLKAS